MTSLQELVDEVIDEMERVEFQRAIDDAEHLHRFDLCEQESWTRYLPVDKDI